MSSRSRRDLLRAAGAAAGLGALGTSSGCVRLVGRVLPARPADDGAPPAASPPAAVDAPDVRLLQRAAFGPSPADRARLESLGARTWLDEQLAAPPGDTDEAPGLLLRLRSLDVANFPAADLRDEDDGALLRQLQQATLLRAVYSRWRLRERLVDFWSNHFNVYARKGYGASYVAVDDAAVIRAHALGTFPELLRATARSPAMLAYLDNQSNRKGVPNENYARELMELHTLGVHGGYTQKDVQEVARCLTGWTIEDRFLRRRGTFRFDPERHDDGPKTVLGHRIPAGGGERDGDRVLDLLAEHPATSRFLARKLVRYFHGPSPAEDAETERIAAVYRSTSGSIPAMLRALLLGGGPRGVAPALLAAPPILKRPFDYVTSALAVTAADTDGGAAVQRHLARMGQPLFQWPMPDGYPDRAQAWTGSLLARWNFALALAGGKLEGTSVDLAGAGPDSLLAAMLPGAPAAVTDPLRAALRPHGADPAARAALVLSSPAFQWR